MKIKSILFLVNAGDKKGFGHLMRCLHLAKGFMRNGIDIHFISHFGGLKLGSMLINTKITYTEIELSDFNSNYYRSNSMQTLSHHGFDLLVIDDYDVTVSLEEDLKKIFKVPIMAIDDLQRDHVCDILLDYSPGRTISSYSGSIKKVESVLLGKDYILIDERFSEMKKHVSLDGGIVKSILISLGGNPNPEFIQIIVATIKKTQEPLRVNLLSIDDKISSVESTQSQFNHYRWVDNMAEFLLHQDIVIGAAGVSSWERCCMGKVSIAIDTANNQRENLAILEAHHAAMCIEKNHLSDELFSKLSMLLESKELRSSLAKCSYSMCDGLGVKRTVKEVMAI